MPTPLTTDELLEQSKAMLEQTKSEGSKPFAGSSYDKPKPVSVLSSDAGSKIIQQDLKTLAEASQPKKAPTIPLMEPIKTTKPTKIEPQEPPTGGLSVEELQSAGINDPVGSGLVFDARTNQYYAHPNTQAGKLAQAYKDYQTKVTEANNSLSTQGDWVLEQMRGVIAGSDADLADTLTQIANDYQTAKTRLEDVNNRTLASINTALVRGGTARYVPTLKATIMGAEEREGIQKLSELARKNTSMMIEAKQAAKSKKFDQLNDYMSELSKIKEQQTTTAKELLDNKTKYEKAITEEMSMEEEKENAYKMEEVLTNIVSSGITDPLEILSTIQGSGIKATSEDVSNFLTNVSRLMGGSGDIEKLTGDAKNFFILKGMRNALPTSITSLPDNEQLGAFVRWQKDLVTSPKAQAIGNGVTPSGGESGFEQFSNEQIALSAIPTQLRNSDVELKRYITGIRQGLKDGMSPYDISDQLIGYKINNPSDFSNGMRQYIAQSNLDASEIQNVARLINSGNNAGAISLIEDKVLNTQKKIDPDGFVGESTARYYSSKVDEIKNELVANGFWDAVGPVEGGIANITGKVSLFKRGEASKVQSKVTSFVAEMRNHLSGSAVTESEKKFLEPLIASLSDKKGVFEIKLDEIKNNALKRHNQARLSGNLPELTNDTLINKQLRASLYAKPMENDTNQFEDQSADLLQMQLPAEEFWNSAQ